MTDLGFGITLALKDLFTKNAGKIEQSYKSLDGTVASASDSISKNLERVQKGAMLVGAGLATLAIPAALAASTMASQKALGEMRSLGIKDLQALAKAAEEFSNRWSGTTKAEFIAASYDIKSGIASLSDFAVGEYTKLAALTAKATKSTTAEMTSLFATGYGIYKTMYGKLSDIVFGEMFAGGIPHDENGDKYAGELAALDVEESVTDLEFKRWQLENLKLAVKETLREMVIFKQELDQLTPQRKYTSYEEAEAEYWQTQYIVERCNGKPVNQLPPIPNRADIENQLRSKQTNLSLVKQHK